MFYLVITVFPIIAIISGLVSLVAVVKFVAQIYVNLKEPDPSIVDR